MTEKNLPTLSSPIEELEEKLLAGDNVEDIKAIIDLFNVNIQKKNIIRTNKLNELQDKVYEQISDRIENNASTFSNRDLLDCFKVIQDTISKAELDSGQLNIPQIQLNQNNLNINMGLNLNRDARERITDVVKNIIQNGQIEEIEEEDYSEDDK